jgi:hypothetical protein
MSLNTTILLNAVLDLSVVLVVAAGMWLSFTLVGRLTKPSSIRSRHLLPTISSLRKWAAAISGAGGNLVTTSRRRRVSENNRAGSRSCASCGDRATDLERQWNAAVANEGDQPPTFRVEADDGAAR